MKLFKIADLYVGIDFRFETLKEQTPIYETTDKPEIIDIVVRASDEAIENAKIKYPGLTDNNYEYLITGTGFYNILIDFDGLMIHSSAVLYKDGVYLFSADSGTGKSTHTQLWLKAFGEEAQILNDDKPAIRIIDGKVYAYGTPWSGKTNLNVNTKAELKGICFIERGEKNEIQKVDAGQVIGDLLKQTIRPTDAQRMNKLLDNVNELLSHVSVYRMKCNMDVEAAHVAYEGMK